MIICAFFHVCYCCFVVAFLFHFCCFSAYFHLNKFTKRVSSSYILKTIVKCIQLHLACEVTVCMHLVWWFLSPKTLKNRHKIKILKKVLKESKSPNLFLFFFLCAFFPLSLKLYLSYFYLFACITMSIRKQKYRYFSHFSTCMCLNYMTQFYSHVSKCFICTKMIKQQRDLWIKHYWLCCSKILFTGLMCWQVFFPYSMLP
mgnify:CR=1 FL=1